MIFVLFCQPAIHRKLMCIWQNRHNFVCGFTVVYQANQKEKLLGKLDSLIVSLKISYKNSSTFRCNLGFVNKFCRLKSTPWVLHAFCNFLWASDNLEQWKIICFTVSFWLPQNLHAWESHIPYSKRRLLNRPSDSNFWRKKWFLCTLSCTFHHKWLYICRFGSMMVQYELILSFEVKKLKWNKLKNTKHFFLFCFWKILIKWQLTSITKISFQPSNYNCGGGVPQWPK